VDIGPTPASAAPTSGPPSSAPTVADLNTFYGIPEYGQISFVYSVKRAFLAGAIGLAVVIVVFSGVWPYLKCVLMGIAWFVPMPTSTCTRILEFACWFGRFSLVDVFAVLVITIGIDFDLVGGGIKIRTQSRQAIVAFGIVAIWALFQSEWMLKIQRHGQYRAINYKGFEGRPQGLSLAHFWKWFWDALAHRVGLCILASICFALAVAALSGPGYTYEIDDVITHKRGDPRFFALGTLFFDVRLVDFPAVVCLLTAIFLPIATPIFVFAWALTGAPHSYGHALSQMGRLSSMDVLFIAAVVFGSEYSALLPTIIQDVSPCYKVQATAQMGYGIILCIVHGIMNCFLVGAIDHNVQWTLCPRA